ncbi:MAG: hypothetical protein VX255_00640 [Candidatus Latescibacterota bacterium]|nr:hypothetical protein [Candidatus Latescibacterota bacterium]
MPSKPSLPNLPTIKGHHLSAPPAWALLERELFALMEDAARLYARDYFEAGGATLMAEDVDDLYEQCYNFGLFYALGAHDDLLELHLRHWNAVTRVSDSSFQHRTQFNEHKKIFRPSIYREFWSHSQAMEWHHLSEGNMAFYDFGVADPTISENERRARRFADMFTGDDPEAPNYDKEHRILRSPFHSAQGPVLEGDVEFAHTMLYAGRGLGGSCNYYGVRASLYPVVKDLEVRWYEDPARAKQIVDLFNQLVLQCDTPNSLAATALVTHAYLQTGDERYKRWVLEYTEAWWERTKANGGICPDNVDAQGVIGGGREGCWWGGQYGWNHYQGYNIMFHGINIAVECCQLLTGDSNWLEFLRSQVRLLVDNGFERPDGQFVVPTRYGPDGWDLSLKPPGPSVLDGIDMRGYAQEASPMRPQEMVHLYHASMADEDRELIDSIRERDTERDWNDVDVSMGEKNRGQTELPRFQYYQGRNPGWPEQILRAEYAAALKSYRQMVDDDRTHLDIIQSNQVPMHLVLTKALTQVTTGAPQSIYNGGLLRATVRYYDADRQRPGLPPDTAALVDELSDRRVGVQLVNCHRNEARRLIVQAGAFGEHRFGEIRFEQADGEGLDAMRVDGRYVLVELPAGAAIRLDADLERFCETPSYAFPWHQDGIPVPFPQASAMGGPAKPEGRGSWSPAP